jgi:hypothetical protein
LSATGSKLMDAQSQTRSHIRKQKPSWKHKAALKIPVVSLSC